MRVIMVRGTSGSGKTTAVRKVMDDSRLTNEIEISAVHPHYPKRRLILATRFKHRDGHFVYFHGKYTTACGGVDSLSYKGAADDVCNRVMHQYRGGDCAVLEGLTMSTWGQQRIVDMSKEVDGNLYIFVLTTTLEDCLQCVVQRRLAKGNTSPLNPKNTTSKHRNIVTGSKKLLAAGVNVAFVDRDELPEIILGLLER